MKRGHLNSIKRQEGLTLIELMLVLAISMAIVVGGLLWYKSVKSTQMVSEAVQNLGALTSSVRTQFNPQGNFKGLTNQVALLSSSFPQYMNVLKDGTSISDGWDSQGVTLAPATINASDDAFTVTYQQIPQSACVNIADQTYRNYYMLTVNGTQVNDAATAATACQTGNANTMVWEISQ